MPASDYPSKVILVGQEAGTAEERDEFNQELFDKFDEHSDPKGHSRTLVLRGFIECFARHLPVD